MREHMSLKEAAHRLGYQYQTLGKLLTEGRADYLQAVKIGTRWRIPMAAVERAITMGTKEATSYVRRQALGLVQGEQA